MSKKKKRSVPVAPPKQEKKMVIDMNAINLKKEHSVPGFRTGKHMTKNVQMYQQKVRQAHDRKRQTTQEGLEKRILQKQRAGQVS